jgi:hypothetical protein
MTSRPASPDATLVNPPPRDERTSVRLNVPCGKSNILNSVVFDAAGQSLYTIASNSKRTTFVECKDNAEIATVQWDRSSPRIKFRGKKMKCREWLPPAPGHGTESVQAPMHASILPSHTEGNSPGLAYSHMVTRNSFGCRGHHPPLPGATCVSPAIGTPF